MAASRQKKWVCSVCGYEHEGPEPPDVCPICGEPASAFELSEESTAPPAPSPTQEVHSPAPASAGSGEWYKVAAVGELEDGQSRVVMAADRALALTLSGGEYGAIENECPHQQGPLGEGTLDDKGILRCPWHGWGFCPRTGKGPGNSAVASFPVEVRDDGIYVQVAAVEPEVTTISDIMVQTMANWGVTHVFGMVGHSNLGLAESIRKAQLQGKLTFVGIRHEGAAAFACSGFAKACGRPAACLTIAGPGATNLLTGLWDAKVDRAPLLALTGQVNAQVLGPGAFQEIDLASAFQAATTWSQTVLHTSNHAELMSLALKHAVVKQDVAHLMFPDEVQVLPATEDAVPLVPEGRLADTAIRPSHASLDKAVQLIAKARRPAVIVGHGARGCMETVVRLAERINAPVITTFKAKGLLPDSHPLATGVLGRSGTPVAARCMTDSDLLIVLGASFSNHTGIDPNRPIIQVDLDRMALGKFHSVTLPIWGEIGRTSTLLVEQLPDRVAAEDQREKIAQLWQEWRDEKRRRAAKDQGKGVNSAVIFQHLSGIVPADAVIAVDVGNNTYSFGRYFECQRQTVIMSGYLGSIGFGFPAAMGAWAAFPDKPIVSVSGDGGFAQYMGEFTTAVKYGMNTTHVLLNNGELGKISKEQRDSKHQVWETALHNPNFAAYATNAGGLGIRVTDSNALPPALKEALATPGPALIEILADPELI